MTEDVFARRIADAFQQGRVRGLHEARDVVRSSEFGRFEAERIERHICSIIFKDDNA